MGVERAVTRWYLQRQSLGNEIAQLEAQLAQILQKQSQSDATSQSTTASLQSETALTPSSGHALTLTLDDVEQQLTKARVKLKTLGPCPKPMMG